MAFVPGDHVHVDGLGSGVILDVRNGNRFLVGIKARSLVVSGDQLAALEPKRRRRTARAAGLVASEQPSARRTHKARSLDLHGATVLEAQDAVARFVNEALLAQIDEVRIIHGRSGGRVKAAVHAALQQVPSVRFRIDPHNPGVTIVTL